jgi:hypothetical protein
MRLSPEQQPSGRPLWLFASLRSITGFGAVFQYLYRSAASDITAFTRAATFRPAALVIRFASIHHRPVRGFAVLLAASDNAAFTRAATFRPTALVIRFASIHHRPVARVELFVGRPQTLRLSPKQWPCGRPLWLFASLSSHHRPVCFSSALVFRPALGAQPVSSTDCNATAVNVADAGGEVTV